MTSSVRIGAHDGFSLDGAISVLDARRPWMRRHLNERVPFLLVPLIAQLSALLPPGISVPIEFWFSTGLLGLMVVLWMLLPRVVPQGNWVLGAPLLTSGIYTASIALLMGATSATRSGLGILLLLPVVGVALYGDVWESFVMVPVVVLAISLVDVFGGSSGTVLFRQIVFYFVLGAMTSASIQMLRSRLVASSRRKRRLLHQAEMLSFAAERLSVLSNPSTIMSLGAELAAGVSLPAANGDRLGLYLEVEGQSVSVVARYDERGDEAAQCWLLADHPVLAEAVASGKPVVEEIDTATLGVSLRRMAEASSITHAVWVPVLPGGTLHGVLAIAGRGLPVSEEAVQQCIALGHLLELALSNWMAHERLEGDARDEERRRIARDLHDGVAHELAYMAGKARTSSSSKPSAHDEMRELADAADRALDEARRAISVLSSPNLERLQLCVAQTAEDMCARFGMDVRLDLDDGVELPATTTENVLRIIREAITNAGRHGAASTVSVRLAGDHGVHLCIEDDGRGFDPSGPIHSAGFGLLSMQERAASIGATFEVRSAPAQGTRVDLVFS